MNGVLCAIYTVLGSNGIGAQLFGHFHVPWPHEVTESRNHSSRALVAVVALLAAEAHFERNRGAGAELNDHVFVRGHHPVVHFEKLRRVRLRQGAHFHGVDRKIAARQHGVEDGGQGPCFEGMRLHQTASDGAGSQGSGVRELPRRTEEKVA